MSGPVPVTPLGYDRERWGDFRRSTKLPLRRLFEEVLPAGCVEVESHGGVPASIAFLHRLVAR